jgi:hypothetical protein
VQLLAVGRVVDQPGVDHQVHIPGGSRQPGAAQFDGHAALEHPRVGMVVEQPHQEELLQLAAMQRGAEALSDR